MVFLISFSAFAFGALARLGWLGWLLLSNLMYLHGWHGWFQGLCQNLHFVLCLQPFCHKVDKLFSIQAGVNPAALDNMTVKGVARQAHHSGLCWGIRALNVEALGGGGDPVDWSVDGCLQQLLESCGVECGQVGHHHQEFSPTPFGLFHDDLGLPI